MSIITTVTYAKVYIDVSLGRGPVHPPPLPHPAAPQTSPTFPRGHSIQAIFLPNSPHYEAVSFWFFFSHTYEYYQFLFLLFDEV